MPSRPLSSTRLEFWVDIEPGQVSVDFTVPTVADNETEGEEQVRFKFKREEPPGTGFEVTGKVANAA